MKPLDLYPTYNTYSYQEFLSLSESLAAENKTTGHNQSEAYVNFSKLNLSRMKRLNKTLVLSDAIIEKLNVTCLQTWIVITEAWCGDSAQNLPYIAALCAAAGEKITLHILLRDEHPEWINAYLTNGGKSIPKWIIFDENAKELATWGPRPKTAQQMSLEWRQKQDKSFDEYEQELHMWYTKNKGAEFIDEALAIFNKLP